MSGKPEPWTTEDEAHRPMSMADLLAQDVFWCPRSGAIIRLANMSGTHLANVRRWLRSYAPQIMATEVGRLYYAGDGAQGEQARADLHADAFRLEQADPHEWIEGQPLLRKIGELLSDDARRNAASREDEATRSRDCPACGAQAGQLCVSLASPRPRVLEHPHARRMAP